MKIVCAFLFIFVIEAVLCHHHPDHDKLEKMETQGIVPELIDKIPDKLVQVTYKDKKVDIGNELTPTEVKDEPTVSWDANSNTYYTLAMVDPDAPRRQEPTYRSVNHWLLANIPGNDISKAEIITAYIGSGPPQGSGLHRYVFLVYQQPKKLDFDEPRTLALSRAHRIRFDIRKFAEKYNLGDPIAMNFYNAQWDIYVDIRNKVVNLENQGIIPDVIDRVPTKSINITYGSKSVESGNELKPEDVKEAPQIKWEAEEGAYYTLAMVDPDAPSREDPKFRSFNHWLVTNIVNNDVKKGDEITSYVGSLPPRNTDVHRYAFLVYRQPKKLSFDEPKASGYSCKNRLSFDLRKFAKKYNLGNPIAGNFYNCQWNQYVDTIKLEDCPA